MPPDSQGYAIDGRRFALCSFGDTQKEEDPAHQIQAMDPRPSRPAVGATQGTGLQGGFLSKKPQSLPVERTADGSGDCQRSLLGVPSAQSEKPTFSEVENLLYPMTSHLSLTQGENDNQGLIGDPGSGRAQPTAFIPLSETPSSKLLEGGKVDWETRGGNGALLSS